MVYLPYESRETRTACGLAENSSADVRATKSWRLILSWPSEDHHDSVSNTFSMLSRGLYEPLIEKTSERLRSSTREITEKYASRGFSIPPGAMYAEIGECYKASIPMRAEIIFDCCCQAYKASTPKAGTEEFSKELLNAISREQNRILASGQAQFNQFDAQFKIPRYPTLLERYKGEILSEGRRLLRYYGSKAIVFLGEFAASATSIKIDNPLEIKPNFFGIGIDIKKIEPWIRNKLRK